MQSIISTPIHGFAIKYQLPVLNVLCESAKSFSNFIIPDAAIR